MLKIPTKYLLLVNGLLWTAIGVKIGLTGVGYYGRLESVPWWYFVLSAGIRFIVRRWRAIHKPATL